MKLLSVSIFIEPAHRHNTSHWVEHRERYISSLVRSIFTDNLEEKTVVQHINYYHKQSLRNGWYSDYMHIKTNILKNFKMISLPDENPIPHL